MVVELAKLTFSEKIWKQYEWLNVRSEGENGAWFRLKGETCYAYGQCRREENFHFEYVELNIYLSYVGRGFAITISMFMMLML